MQNSRQNIKPNKYEDFLMKRLSHLRFLSGNDCLQGLSDEFGITKLNARKILQRAVQRGFILSSKPYTFGKGQFAYLHHEEILDKNYIKEISKKNRPPLYRLIDALDNSNGIISYYEALKVTASPEEKTSSKINTLKELLSILVELKICCIKTDERFVRYIIYTESIDDRTITLSKELVERIMMNDHYSRMVLDSMFIPDILRWLRKINFIDNIKTIYRSKTSPSRGTLHNGIIWDAYAYTKTTGINPIVGKKAQSEEKQTLVVLDVVIHRNYEQTDLDGFLSRVQINLNSVKTGIRKVMPVVIYKSISPQVLNTLASLGFLGFDIGVIFGTRIYEVVEKLNIVQLNVDSLGDKDIEDTIATTLSTIRKTGQEENLNDIKGVLFEFLLYPLLKSLYPNAAFSHGRMLSKKNELNKEGYEYDYIIQSSNPKEIIVIELKGYTSNASIPLGNIETKNTLHWFFKRTLPFAQKFFEKEISEGYKFRASYITSANFYDNGKEFLKNINLSRLKPTNMECYYDGENLLSLLKENDFSKIKKTIEKYYINKEPSIVEM
jgi:hypothetical protein